MQTLIYSGCAMQKTLLVRYVYLHTYIHTNIHIHVDIYTHTYVYV
jgi:hypothetical protein